MGHWSLIPGIRLHIIVSCLGQETGNTVQLSLTSLRVVMEERQDTVYHGYGRNSEERDAGAVKPGEKILITDLLELFSTQDIFLLRLIWPNLSVHASVLLPYA